MSIWQWHKRISTQTPLVKFIIAIIINCETDSKLKLRYEKYVYVCIYVEYNGRLSYHLFNIKWLISLANNASSMFWTQRMGFDICIYQTTHNINKQTNCVQFCWLHNYAIVIDLNGCKCTWRTWTHITR